MFSHRTLVSGRIPELLDHLKAEYENLAHDVNMYKVQKDDFERKLQAQLTTLSDIQRTLMEYETSHTKLKHQYEEEILRLRRQIEFQNSSAGTNFHNSGEQGEKPSSAPNIMSNGSAMFFSLGNLSPMNKDRFPNNSSLPPTPSGSLPPVSAPSSNSLSNSSSASMNTTPSPSNPLNKRPRDNENFFPQSGFPPLNTSLPSMGEPTKTAKVGDKKEEGAFPILSSLRDSGKGDSQFPNRLPNPSSISAPSLNLNPSAHLAKNNTTNIPGSSKNGIERQKADEPIEIGSGPESRRTAEETPPVRPSERDEHKKDDIDWGFSGNAKHQGNLKIDLSLNLTHSSVVCCVKFSNDGKYIASGCKSSAQIYDVQTGEKLQLGVHFILFFP
eukprot:TRINITY_DN788_c0_g2_i1.p1 TRINITY_DN788_c0_g2~~TRINITY_DN788_c0_g2_i1.p1  ORF type:complete len:385 (+),score=67.39 TRINITY_DN788_c0_g2_i1:119-1273(+)